MPKLNVVLSGIFYPMAILRYFEEAFSRRDDVNLITVGPYTGAWIPWENGMNLPEKYAVSPDIALFSGRNFSRTIPISAVESRLPFKPDLWVQIDAGFYMYGKPEHGKHYTVGTDPHVLDYRSQRRESDEFFCMQHVYRGRNDKFLPYAFSPTYHGTLTPAAHADYDIAMLGVLYKERVSLMNALRGLGRRVYMKPGDVFDESRDIYSLARASVNWSSLLDLTARVFEILGMGLPLFANKVPDLSMFFREQELIVFEGLNDAIDKITYYLDHPTEMAAIAAAGHKAVQPHTWDARIDQLLRGEDYS